jgi:hypothetical protein
MEKSVLLVILKIDDLKDLQYHIFMKYFFKEFLK